MVRTLLACLLAMALVPFANAQPANDDFANAQAITGARGSVSGTNVAATVEGGEPQFVTGPLLSVWYVWQAPFTGPVTFNTCNATSDYDTTLGVYTGASVAALSTVATNDDTCGLLSSVTFNATQGTNYYIQVAGWGGSTGNFLLAYGGPDVVPTMSQYALLLMALGLVFIAWYGGRRWFRQAL